MRETVESLAIALVLAFLVRTFEAEPFVIPTGSMAPTLMGRHKDFNCPECGYQYRVGASEVLSESGEPTGYRVIAGTCPMCRFTADLTPDNTLQRAYPSYSGDRILAGRFDYELGEPQRWDVAVFHYPLAAATDFIKRIAGLPNETLRIQYGDVWVKPDGARHFALARKPPDKVLAMMQPVYDDDYWPQGLARQGWPPQWAPMGPAGAAGAWKASPDFKSFRTDGTAPGEAWLGYRHITPGFDDWAYLLGLTAMPPPPPQAQLVRDFTAYDTGELWYFGRADDRQAPPPPPLPDGLGQPPSPWRLGLNWVGDLIVEFDLHASEAKGEILVDLVKGGHHFLCRLNLADGAAALTIPGAGRFHASAAGIRGPGEHRVRFANVDQQLLLWIDGRLAQFDAPTTYETQTVDTRSPDKEDLLPARIGSRGAAAEVSHLKLYRDIYYVAQRIVGGKAYPPIPTDLDPQAPGYPYAGAPPGGVARFFSDPAGWGIFRGRLGIEFALKKDQFFMLGDNSAESKDGRLWDETEYYVRRDLLVGKALVVYWPHSWNRIPGTPIPFPLFPNFSRMRLIR